MESFEVDKQNELSKTYLKQQKKIVTYTTGLPDATKDEPEDRLM